MVCILHAPSPEAMAKQIKKYQSHSQSLQARSRDDNDLETHALVGLKPRRLLIIDDDPIFQSFLKECLESYGFHCESTFTAEAALVMLEYVAPELVLLDLELPKASGMDFLKEIKDWIPQERKAPNVIVLSAHNDKCIVDNALDTGAVAFVAKPFKPATLISMIHDYIE